MASPRTAFRLRRAILEIDGVGRHNPIRKRVGTHTYTEDHSVTVRARIFLRVRFDFLASFGRAWSSLTDQARKLTGVVPLGPGLNDIPNLIGLPLSRAISPKSHAPRPLCG